MVDLGEEIGTKKGSTQITKFVLQKELIGTQVIGVTNFPPKQNWSVYFGMNAWSLDLSGFNGNVALAILSKKSQ